MMVAAALVVAGLVRRATPDPPQEWKLFGGPDPGNAFYGALVVGFGVREPRRAA